ncbi:MAG: Omp28-related outer membrane protein [bacterium]|nr:Omp28-related outer membrane protein [bacterium]
MKNFVFLSVLIALLFSGCEETPPQIDFSIPIIPLKDSTYIEPAPAPQHKAVLIEDITGVRCINCPDAAQKAKDIIAQKTSDSVVVMAIYPIEIFDNFTRPYPGVPQLATIISKEIVQALGLPQGLPNGYVDRKEFLVGTRPVSYTEWINKVNIRLQQKTPVNIGITKEITNRNLKVEIKLQYNTNAISGAAHKYAIYIIEDKIVSTQYTQSGNNSNYVHNHALRYAFNLTMGNPLTQTTVPGRTYIKQFEYEMPSEYVIDNCHIICAVLDSVTEEVINVREIDLK